MPVRMPKARGSELFTFGVAGVAGFAPFYFILPGAEQRLATETARWAPRWEKNISYFTPPARYAAEKVEPRVSRTVKRIDDRLPLEKVANMADKRVQAGFDRLDKWNTKA